MRGGRWTWIAVLGLLVGLATSALATGAPTAPRVSKVSLTPDAAACGEGFTLVATAGLPAACIHTRPDSGPLARAAGDPPRSLAVRGPAQAKVPCYGDGQTGPRIQFIYGYLEGERNNTAFVTKQVNKAIAPRMQAVINAQSLGQDLGIRFAMTKGCKAISVIALKLPRDIRVNENGRTGDAGYQIGMMRRFLDAKGLNAPNRVYQVLLDGGSTNACGVAYTPRGGIGSTPYSPSAEGAPLGVERLTGRKLVNFPRLSLVFGGECRVDTYGLSTVTTQIHELFHNLGAVQDDAPHADTGHCFDAPSVMCSGGVEGYGLGVQIPACEKVLVETLDCNMDDYWNPRPRPDSYLATHLNIAKSQYFGPQPADTLEPVLGTR